VQALTQLLTKTFSTDSRLSQTRQIVQSNRGWVGQPHTKMKYGRALRVGRQRAIYNSHSAVQGSGVPHGATNIESDDRPGFNRYNFCPDRHVFFNVDGSVDHMVPHWRIVCTVHNINLNFHGSGQGRVPFILSHGLQLVCFSLY